MSNGHQRRSSSCAARNIGKLLGNKQYLPSHWDLKEHATAHLSVQHKIDKLTLGPSFVLSWERHSETALIWRKCPHRLICKTHAYIPAILIPVSQLSASARICLYPSSCHFLLAQTIVGKPEDQRLSIWTQTQQSRPCSAHNGHGLWSVDFGFSLRRMVQEGEANPQFTLLLSTMIQFTDESSFNMCC